MHLSTSQSTDDGDDFTSLTNSLSRQREEFLRPPTLKLRTMVNHTVNGVVQNGVSGTQNGVAPNPSSRQTVTNLKADFLAKVGFKETQNYVGFANIPNQVYRRAVKQGFDFTLIVVGQSGLGKSTLINSLFLADINPVDGVRSFPQTIRIESTNVRLVEKDVAINLKLIDTPGFGDAVDNSKCWEPVVDHIDRKYQDYFNEETKVARKERVLDNRVHLCLYFIAPTGHGLKQLDIEAMKHLHDRVNVIPVIAKADALTSEELGKFKTQILKDIEMNNIKVYKFPEPDDDDERNNIDEWKKRMPFGVVGSNLVAKDKDGKMVRYRDYPWGRVEVENLGHNDFLALRDMIIRSNLIDMIDVTRGVHYENFRCRQLCKSTINKISDGDPFTHMEQEKLDKEKLFAINKAKMEKVFEDKTKERTRIQADKRVQVELNAHEHKRQLDLKRTELEQLKEKLNELKNKHPEVVSIDSKSSSSSIGGSERNSPTQSDSKFKKKSGTLGSMFGR